MGCIIANTVVLAVKWYMMPGYVITVVEILNYIFMIIFTIEAIIKLIAMRSKYFKDGWNVFDFIIVLGSWGDYVIAIMDLKDDLPIDPSILRLLA